MSVYKKLARNSVWQTRFLCTLTEIFRLAIVNVFSLYLYIDSEQNRQEYAVQCLPPFHSFETWGMPDMLGLSADGRSSRTGHISQQVGDTC